MTDPNLDLTQSLDLVRSAQNGDSGALNLLFERYYERVRRVVRMRLGHKLRQEMDSGDILQETFLAAAKAFDKYEVREEAALINWLAKLAENQIIRAADYHGAQKRNQDRRMHIQSLSGSGNMSDTQSYQLPGDVPKPDDQVAGIEEEELLERCVSELDDEYRELIILREYAGASWEEIARETGRPSSDAARMMHGKAMLELSKLLKEKGVQNED
jgi:RNA polymerase sigma-70 factor (ECF subfamily)